MATVDPLFKRNAAKEAAAVKSGNTTQAEIDARGGINASGYYGDSWSADKNLTDAEYAAASAKGGGAAINAATAAKPANVAATGSAANNTGTTTKDAAYQDRLSAYNILYNEFNKYGLGSMVSDVKNYLVNSTFDPSEFSIELQNTQAYQNRFSANKDRLAKGLRALTPAEYISKEDAYQDIMRQYGLPASYYAKDPTGKQAGFDQLIANGVSDTELEDRLIQGVSKIEKGPKEYVEALRQFYPEISRGDLLAYVLDPKNAITDIKRKVTAVEIGGAALAQGLQTQVGTAESYASQGVTGKQYSEAAPFIAEATQQGGKLASFYNQGVYNQATAEAEALNTTGAAEAAKKRKKLTSLESASFSGSSGVGALGRDKALYGTAYGQQGQY